MAQNYTLGRGELYFGRFGAGTQIPGGERYIGNTPELTLNVEAENLDHFNSDRGIREKDDSIVLEVTRTASFITDNIDPENVALFFFGEKSTKAVATATIADEEINAVKQGLYYQLGVSDAEPSGARGLVVHTAGPPAENIIVTDDGGVPVTFVEGDDYTIDMALGRLYIVPGGGIADATNLLVSYKVGDTERAQILSGAQPVEGAMRFIAQNPKGEKHDYFLPWVKLTPNGDYALKGDEWQQIPFNVEVLRKGDLEAIYIDGRAMAVVP